MPRWCLKSKMRRNKLSTRRSLTLSSRQTIQKNKRRNSLSKRKMRKSSRKDKYKSLCYSAKLRRAQGKIRLERSKKSNRKLLRFIASWFKKPTKRLIKMKP